MEAARGLAAAHEIGIVHCDFKPDNVVIGEDGRARVTDFGLARWEREPAESLGGTPGYVAPEVKGGAAPDAQSDQYSFGVSFAAALSGESADRTERPAGVDALHWRAICRCAATEPVDRFPSMQQALAALNGSRRHWGRWAGAAALAVVIGSIWVGNEVSRQAACAGAASEVAETWNGDRRQSLLRALQTAGDTGAVDSARLSVDAADRYVRDWTRAHRDTCKARHSGVQSEPLLDRRIACLRRRLAGFDALVNALQHEPVRETVDRAVLAFGRLPAPDACRSVQVESDAPPMPAAHHARIERASDALYRMAAHILAGEVDSIEAELVGMRPEVDDLDYSPLTAHYYHQLGLLRDVRGDYAASSEFLERAARAAATARDAAREASVLAALTGLRGYRLGNVEQGKAWADATRLAIERAGEEITSDVQSAYHHNFGMVLLAGGEYSAARKELERAHEIIEREDGPMAPRKVATLDSIGTSFYREGELERAREYHQRAIALGEKVLGKRHLGLASPINNLGLVEWKLGNFDDAIAHFEKSRDLNAEHHGARSVGVSMSLTNIALVMISKADFAGAEKRLDEALPILVEHFGADHPMIATLYSNKAHLASEMGQMDQALRHGEAALRVRRKLGEDHPGVMDDHYNLAGILCAAGRQVEARAHLDAITEKTADKPSAGAWRQRVAEARRDCKTSGGSGG